MKNEEIWNSDLLEIIKNELKNDFPKVRVVKGKVLKDIFLNKNKNKDSLKYSVQFGFVDQDIVIYEEVMDISEFHKVDNILIHNNTGNKNEMIIPKLICELKYNGITSHGLITYSDYASDIKSIFPECKYWLALRFRENSTENKLYRHGKNFDKIIFFDLGKSENGYNKGDFIRQLETQPDLKKRFEEFIKEVKETLREKDTVFVK